MSELNTNTMNPTDTLISETIQLNSHEQKIISNLSLIIDSGIAEFPNFIFECMLSDQAVKCYI